MRKLQPLETIISEINDIQSNHINQQENTDLNHISPFLINIIAILYWY